MTRKTPAATQASAGRYCVYLLECRGGRLYTGITTDIDRRLAEHQTKRRGAKFTRAYPPVKLLAIQPAASRSAALQLEAALKKLRHVEKLAWAAQPARRSVDVR